MEEDKRHGAACTAGNQRIKEAMRITGQPVAQAARMTRAGDHRQASRNICGG